MTLEPCCTRWKVEAELDALLRNCPSITVANCMFTVVLTFCLQCDIPCSCCVPLNTDEVVHLLDTRLTAPIQSTIAVGAELTALQEKVKFSFNLFQSPWKVKPPQCT